MLNPLELAAAPFREQGLRLEEQLLQGAQPDQLPGYVAYGSTSYLYAVEGRSDLVMRLPYSREDVLDTRPATERIMEYVEPLTRGLGHAGLEQVVAISLRDPVCTVSVKAGIKGLDEAVEDGTIARVPTMSYIRLLNVLEKMNTELKLANEHPMPRDFRLGRDDNITVIDYLVWEKWPMPLIDEVIEFAKPGSLIDAAEDYEDKKLPIQAVRYHRAVRYAMGRRVASALRSAWKEHDFEIPRRWEIFG